MGAHGFCMLVALDTHGATIPTGDRAVWRQHIDSVIRYALDQQAELLFTRMQGLRRLLAFSNVAGNFSKTDQGTLTVPNRIDDHAGPKACAVLAHAPTFILEL